MAKKPLPTPGQLRQLLRYEAETGKLFWLPRHPSFFVGGSGSYTPERTAKTWNKRYAGTEALSAISSEGYKNGTLLGRYAAAHRVIWAVVHGYWPEFIDHINGCRDDNRLLNLREVTKRENGMNQGRKVNNSSGVTGVHLRGDNGKWIAQIGVGMQRVYLGAYDTFEDAVMVRQAAEREYGFHRNHGVPRSAG